MTTELTIRAIETVFASPLGHNSRAYWIPMHMYDEVRQAYKDAGIAIRTKFRGSRKDQVGIPMTGYKGHVYFRTARMANQTCLKDYATHFCVYSK